MIYTVKRIDEDLDFGCEERAKDAPVMAVVTLVDSSGEELRVKAEDALLYKNNTNEGDKVCFDKNDPDSVYQYYRRLLALRKDPAYSKTVVYGDLLPVFEDQDRVMAYYRKSADQTLLVIGNYKTQPQTLTLPSKIKNIVLNNLPQLKTDGNEITLEGYQAVVLEV